MTRKIERLAHAMGIENISASQVSEFKKELDAQVEDFKARPLAEEYPFLWIDALYQKVRVEGRVVSVAVRIACGVNPAGSREILAMEPMFDESEDSWEEQDKKKGWKKVVTIRGTQFIMDWDVEMVKRRGRPSKKGDSEDLIFSGRLAPRFSELILTNLSFHRILEIPRIAYRMSHRAQLLYRHGQPFVLRRGGWWLTYSVACRALGYPETPIDFQTGTIDGYVDEITQTVGWRRDKKTERLRGGLGQDRL